jgi:hypothetical protein
LLVLVCMITQVLESGINRSYFACFSAHESVCPKPEQHDPKTRESPPQTFVSAVDAGLPPSMTFQSWKHPSRFESLSIWSNARIVFLCKRIACLYSLQAYSALFWHRNMHPSRPLHSTQSASSNLQDEGSLQLRMFMKSNPLKECNLQACGFRPCQLRTREQSMIPLCRGMQLSRTQLL